VRVRYIDYGNEADISFRDLRILPREIKFIPSYAIECKLSSVQRNPRCSDEEWIRGIKKFKAEMIDKLVDVVVLSTEKNTKVVEIFKSNINFSDYAVDLGVLERIKEERYVVHCLKDV